MNLISKQALKHLKKLIANYNKNNKIKIKIKTEYSIITNYNQKRIFDIVLFTKNNRYCIIEICNTNPVSLDKKKDICNYFIEIDNYFPIYEFHVNDIIKSNNLTDLLNDDSKLIIKVINNRLYIL